VKPDDALASPWLHRVRDTPPVLDRTKPSLPACDGTTSPSRAYSGKHRIRHPQGITAMKTIATLLAVAALSLAANSADAKGCLKGAVVGGVAGHYAGHHGVLGAAAGCLYGRHRANEQARQQQGQPDPHGQDNNKL
jgi:outer membrane lipoprotein SlyB